MEQDESDESPVPPALFGCKAKLPITRKFTLMSGRRRPCKARKKKTLHDTLVASDSSGTCQTFDDIAPSSST